MNLGGWIDLERLIIFLLNWAIIFEHRSRHIPPILVANLLQSLSDDPDFWSDQDEIQLIVEKHWERIDLNLFETRQNALNRLHLELQKINFLAYGKSLSRLMASKESDNRFKRLTFLLNLPRLRDDDYGSTERHLFVHVLGDIFQANDIAQLKISEQLCHLLDNASGWNLETFFPGFDSLSAFHQYYVISSLRCRFFKSFMTLAIGDRLNLLAIVVGLYGRVGEYCFMSEFLVDTMGLDISGNLLAPIGEYVSEMRTEFHVCNSLRTLVAKMTERVLFLRRKGPPDYKVAECLMSMIRTYRDCRTEKALVMELLQLDAPPKQMSGAQTVPRPTLLDEFFNALRSSEPIPTMDQIDDLLLAVNQELIKMESIFGRFIHEIMSIEPQGKSIYLSGFVRYIRRIMDHQLSIDPDFCRSTMAHMIFSTDDLFEENLQLEICSGLLIIFISRGWSTLKHITNYMLDNLQADRAKDIFSISDNLIESLVSTPFLLRNSIWDICEYRDQFDVFINTENGLNYIFALVRLFAINRCNDSILGLTRGISYVVQTPQFRSSLFTHFKSMISQAQSLLHHPIILDYFTRNFVLLELDSLSCPDGRLQARLTYLFSHCFPHDMGKFMLILVFLTTLTDLEARFSTSLDEIMETLVRIALNVDDIHAACELLRLAEFVLPKHIIDSLCLTFFKLVLDESSDFRRDIPSRPIHPLILSKMAQFFSVSDLQTRQRLFTLFGDILNSRKFPIQSPNPVTDHESLIGTSGMGSLFIILGCLHYRLDWMTPKQLSELLSGLIHLMSRLDIFEWPNLYSSLRHVLMSCMGALMVSGSTDLCIESINKMLLDPTLPDNVRHYLMEFSPFGVQSSLHGLEIRTTSWTKNPQHILQSSYVDTHFGLSKNLEDHHYAEKVHSRKATSSIRKPQGSSDTSCSSSHRAIAPVMWIEGYPETTRCSLPLSMFDAVTRPRSTELVYEKQFKIGLQRQNMR
jgi:hypothetical protein